MKCPQAQRQQATILGLALLAPFGCRTGPPRSAVVLEPLTIVETVPVAYESVVAPLSAIESNWTEAAVATDPTGAVIQVDVEVLELGLDVAAELLGAPAGLGGWVADRKETLAALQELIDTGRAQRVHEARLGVHEKQPAWVSIQRQEAYVASYSVSRSPASLLADPTVATVREGFRMRTIAELDSARAALLDIELTMVELEQPIQTAQVTIPGSATPVTLQLPVAKQQILSTGLRLTDEHCALLSGLAVSGQHENLLVYLSVRSHP